MHTLVNAAQLNFVLADLIYLHEDINRDLYSPPNSKVPPPPKKKDLYVPEVYKMTKVLEDWRENG